jgi:hypothetical protein
MADFSPYITLEDTSVRLVLEEPRWRQHLHFFLLRILPFIVAITFFIGMANSDFPSHLQIIISIFFLVYVVVLLNIPYIIKAEITPIAVVITSNRLFNTAEETIVISDVEKIVSRIRHGKHKALLYYLVLKTNRKRKRFLSFNRFRISNENRTLINNKLQSITGLQADNL